MTRHTSQRQAQQDEEDAGDWLAAVERDSLTDPYEEAHVSERALA